VSYGPDNKDFNVAVFSRTGLAKTLDNLIEYMFRGICVNRGSVSTDKSSSDFVNLGKLKANMGNQNYEIPQGTDLERYDTVLIWCKAFSVLFGSAEL
jgi:hypothetical protein